MNWFSRSYNTSLFERTKSIVLGWNSVVKTGHFLGKGLKGMQAILRLEFGSEYQHSEEKYLYTKTDNLLKLQNLSKLPKGSFEAFCCKTQQMPFVRWIHYSFSNEYQGFEKTKFSHTWIQSILRKKLSHHSSKLD